MNEEFIQDPIHILEFDLLCKKPESLTPMYRIYVDNDLLAEREYYWDNTKEYVRERCEMRLPVGSHIVEIFCAEREKGIGFTIANAALDGKNIQIELDGIFKIEQ